MQLAGAASRDVGESEILDTGVFDEDRYFDVQIEYAKADGDKVSEPAGSRRYQKMARRYAI